ncbi:glycine cleavage system aminomethyltransferase GcvT [Nigerium massiliense]|uniref:glycine cleavage system aminomethyltransferase GcvT n=1 Tax=Nigerium massiliense TaxID=1522317 RepID=UPI00058B11E2|nr:glycine cleavage system aminomethyltransferase GcvT [Nigerium massiliense]
MPELRKSPLHSRHEALGAKFAEFGGWSMPLQYTSVVAEHKAVRSAVGIFDVSHLGGIRVVGPNARGFLNTCFTNDLEKIGPGQAQYTLACTRMGGVIDDIIVYLVRDDHLFCVPNAANNADILQLLKSSAPAAIEVTNEHTVYAKVAVQGPQSDEVLAALGAPVDHDYMKFRSGTIAGVDVTVCRTGYTGERGYELMIPAEDAGPVWDALMDAGAAEGITPCGLGARDTLRTEMGYPLHGHELSLDIDPIEGQCSWAVGWNKPEFWGSEALKERKAQGVEQRIRALKSAGRGIPRPGMKVLNDAGEEIGFVTSGTFSPTLNVGIALAMVDVDVLPGSAVKVDIRGRQEPFSVEKPPLVEPQVRQK